MRQRPFAEMTEPAHLMPARVHRCHRTTQVGRGLRFCGREKYSLDEKQKKNQKTFGKH